MNNGIKKAIALVSALGVVFASVPMVMAEDADDVNINIVENTDADATAEDGIVYYDESFDDFPVGTLVNLQNGSNTNYKDRGFEFACGTRSGGGSNEVSISVQSGNYIEMAMTAYIDKSRTPSITLTKTSGATFKNAMVMSMKVKMNDFNGEGTGLSLRFVDANNTEYTYTNTTYVDKWIDLTLVKQGGKMTTISKDEDGNVLGMSSTQTSFEAPAKIMIPDLGGKIGIDDLKIEDKVYEFDPEVVIYAAKNDLNIANVNTSGVTEEDDGSLTITKDFVLPTTSMASVTWKTYSKPKADENADWTESDFITVAGLNATINPTSDINDYDVKLVAEISYSDVMDPKEFFVNLPNPLDEINAVLTSGYEVLTSPDYADKYVCSLCGNVYDVETGAPDNGVVAGTPWANVPESFECPGEECTGTKANYTQQYLSYDLKSNGVLKYDVNFPLSVKGYDNTTISWTTSDAEHLAIDEKGNGTIMTVDFNSHPVTVTAVVTYKKGNIVYSSDDQTFNLSVEYNADDVASDLSYLSKYKVRFDKEYEDNFKTIPTSISSDITLPNKGYFGSTISWTSSAPTILSSTGTFTRPSSTRTITLTAAIMSGKEQVTKNFSLTAQGKTTSSGGSGGGGGSTSSTGTTTSTGGGSTISNSTTRPVTDSTLTTGSDKVDSLIQEKEEAENRFTDIGSVSWARDAINGLADAGVINGKTDTEFAPNDNVTRAEFAKILMGVFGLTSEAFTTSSFYDVPTDAWYFNYVETAYNLGIINGVADGVFDPNANITRQDMCVMVVRAAEVSGKSISAVNEAKVFADEASIADYAKSAVTTLQTGGIVDGVSDTVFAPLDNATRAQAAKILYSFL